MGELLVKRRAYSTGLLRRMKVEVDGKRVAALWPGREVRMSLPPGTYDVSCRLDRLRSRTLDVEVTENDATLVEVSSSLRSMGQMFTSPSTALDIRLVTSESSPGRSRSSRLIALGFGLVFVSCLISMTFLVFPKFPGQAFYVFGGQIFVIPGVALFIKGTWFSNEQD